MPLQNIAVFCASASGTDPIYTTAAEELGRALVARNIGLIYGGAKVGLMHSVAKTVLDNGGRVIGVIPHVIVDLEVADHNITELHIVDTMHTRKRLMGEKADAFLILPGGFGTMEEMFEVLAWQSLRLHDKPVVLLNTNGFYDKLLDWMDDAVAQGMLRASTREILLVVTTVEEAFAKLSAS